jgi:hypothetical protein
MSDYIQSAAGAGNPIITMSVTGAAGNLSVPYLQDVTINNANDVFTWSQLNESAKLQVATTATNSIATNIVVEPTTFFGNAAATANSAAKLGLFNLSRNKTEVNFSINLGSKNVTGIGYVTGLAPTVSADSPVWVTPMTITVSGEYGAIAGV